MKVSSFFYVLFTYFLRPFLLLFSFPMKVSSFFYAFFTYFLRFLRPFLLLFSFPMKVSSFFYAFFTYFLRFLRLFFSFFPFQWKCQAFFTHFLRTFYAFYALSSPFFLSNESVKLFLRIFYVLFTLFTPFSSPFFLSNESVKLFLRIFYVLFTPFLLLFSFPMKVSSFFYAFFTYFLRFLRQPASHILPSFVPILEAGYPFRSSWDQKKGENARKDRFFSSCPRSVFRCGYHVFFSKILFVMLWILTHLSWLEFQTQYRGYDPSSWGFVWSSGGQTEFPISLGIIYIYNSYHINLWHELLGAANFQTV